MRFNCLADEIDLLADDIRESEVVQSAKMMDSGFGHTSFI